MVRNISKYDERDFIKTIRMDYATLHEVSVSIFESMKMKIKFDIG